MSACDNHPLLTELAELAMALARDVQAAALKADDLADKQALAATFNQLGRTVRMCLALDAKLDQMALGHAKVKAAFDEHQGRVETHRRRDYVHTALSRQIWAEREKSEYEGWMRLVEARLSEIARMEGFLEESELQLVERLRQEIGLDAAENEPRRAANTS